MSQPKYNIVVVSLEDDDSLSLPVLYFVPNHIKFPKNMQHNYVRCHKSGLIAWLDENSDFTMKTDKYLTVVGKPVVKTVATTIPL